MTHPPSRIWIDSAAALADAAASWARAEWLALDTEFVRETTYYPKLCLIQVSDGANASCIDVLALDAQALAPLLEVLLPAQASAQDKIFHSASQDLEIFVQLAGGVPTPLFDTQIAAALLGAGDQLGYAALVEKRLGVTVDKSLTRTDWSRRPLSAAELAYAADDVRHLAELYPQLREELAARGRLAWLREECARLSDPARYRTRAEDAWRRLKGLARLPAPARGVAAALAAWRERMAQERDRPRKWILDDDALYRIAERAPASMPQLAALEALPPKTLERHGASLLQAVAAANSDGPAVVDEEPPLDEVQKTRLKRLQETVRGLAASLEIPVSLLAPRADLERLARHGEGAGVMLLQGWRRDVAGADVLKLL